MAQGNFRTHPDSPNGEITGKMVKRVFMSCQKQWWNLIRAYLLQSETPSHQMPSVLDPPHE